jgi:hypothetical protein
MHKRIKHMLDIIMNRQQRIARQSEKTAGLDALRNAAREAANAVGNASEAVQAAALALIATADRKHVLAAWERLRDAKAAEEAARVALDRARDELRKSASADEARRQGRHR